MNFRSIFWGTLLIIAGILFLIEEFTGFNFRGFFWPVLFILAGALLLLKDFLNSDASNRSKI